MRAFMKAAAAMSVALITACGAAGDEATEEADDAVRAAPSLDISNGPENDPQTYSIASSDLPAVADDGSSVAVVARDGHYQSDISEFSFYELDTATSTTSTSLPLISWRTGGEQGGYLEINGATATDPYGNVDKARRVLARKRWTKLKMRHPSGDPAANRIKTPAGYEVVYEPGGRDAKPELKLLLNGRMIWHQAVPQFQIAPEKLPDLDATCSYDPRLIGAAVSPGKRTIVVQMVQVTSDFCDKPDSWFAARF